MITTPFFLRGFIHKRWLSENHDIPENFLMLPKLYKDKKELLIYYNEDEIVEVTIKLEVA